MPKTDKPSILNPYDYSEEAGRFGLSKMIRKQIYIDTTNSRRVWDGSIGLIHIRHSITYAIV